MIKLPKKIANAIKKEFSKDDCTILKYVHIRSPFKELCVWLVLFRIGQSHATTILRYFGDDSYSFMVGYYDQKEITDELAYQIKKLF